MEERNPLWDRQLTRLSQATRIRLRRIEHSSAVGHLSCLMPSVMRPCPISGPICYIMATIFLSMTPWRQSAPNLPGQYGSLYKLLPAAQGPITPMKSRRWKGSMATNGYYDLQLQMRKRGKDKEVLRQVFIYCMRRWFRSQPQWSQKSMMSHYMTMWSQRG